MKSRSLPKKGRRLLLAPVGAAVAILLALTGCSRSSAQTPSAGPGGPAVPAVAAGEAPEPAPAAGTAEPKGPFLWRVEDVAPHACVDVECKFRGHALVDLPRLAGAIRIAHDHRRPRTALPACQPRRAVAVHDEATADAAAGIAECRPHAYRRL